MMAARNLTSPTPSMDLSPSSSVASAHLAPRARTLDVKEHWPLLSTTTRRILFRVLAPILKKLEKKESVDSIAYIDSEVNQIITNNIIAQTSAGDPDNCVMLGAHSDSVTEGPGINDDGSGTISLLEVATQLTKFNVTNCVRFAWWAGEEEGLLGSDYYVATLPKKENQKIRLFMDYDMMASPNFAYQIYNATNALNPEGSEELKNLYIDWYEEQGLNYTFIPFDGRSDYDGFIRNGIPGGGIATGAEGIKTKKEVEMFGGKAGEWYDNCYHQLCDDLGNLNMTAFVVNTKVRFPMTDLSVPKLTLPSSLLIRLQLTLFPSKTSLNARVSRCRVHMRARPSITDPSCSSRCLSLYVYNHVLYNIECIVDHFLIAVIYFCLATHVHVHASRSPHQPANLDIPLGHPVGVLLKP
jgi:hypothetical protein